MRKVLWSRLSAVVMAFLTLFFFASPSYGANVLLVEDGQSLAPIVVFEDAPPLTRLAADDLAHYIEKISGARPDVIEGEPAPLPENAIWVGYQPVMEEVFPDINFDFEHPEEILIAANDNHLVIAGRDRWDPENLFMEARHFQFGLRDVEGYQQEYGTANAVYTFLQDYLDVRWLWPGEEDIIARDTLEFSPFKYRYHPTMRQRQTMLYYLSRFRASGPGNRRTGVDWVRFQRLRLDSLDTRVQGHGFSDWWDRFHETNPEYFALQPDGTRSGFPRPNAAKICESNPAVWEQWISDVEATLAENPHRRVFNAAANDSWASGHCICPDCRAWDHPDGKPLRFTWQGLSQNYVALSDRQVRFANQLGRQLKERFPDEDYYVVIFSYGLSRPAPQEAVPDDNVIVGLVHNFFQRPPEARQASRQRFLNWTNIAKNFVWRPNMGNPARWQTGGPPDLAEAIEDLRLVNERGCMGINIDKVWNYFATQGPLYYLMAQMPWDPDLDGEAILEDYYQRGFGPAAEEVKAYWELLGQARRQVFKPDTSWNDAFDSALFQNAESLLQQGREKVGEDKERYAPRLDFVKAGLDFLRLKTDSFQLAERLRASEGDDAEALEKLTSNWEQIQEIAREYQNERALNYGHVFRSARGYFSTIYPGSYE